MIEERLVAPTWVARRNRTAAPACLKAQSGLHFCAFGATVQPCRATNAGATRLDSRASVPRRPERGQFVLCWRGCLVLSRHYEWRDCSALSRLLKWCDNCALLRQRASTPRKVCNSGSVARLARPVVPPKLALREQNRSSSLPVLWTQVPVP